MKEEQKWIRSIVKRGSEEAADKLISIYYDDVYKFIYFQVGNKEDAMDLTQESFIAALRSLPFYDAKKASFKTWIYHIATHKVIDARRKYRPVTIPLEEDIYQEEDFAANIENKELLRKIEEYVCTLEPDLQEIFRLRIYGDYTFPEIAFATQQAEEKVKAKYYRLMKRIRKEFEAYE